MTATAQTETRRANGREAVETYMSRLTVAAAWREDNVGNPLRDVLWRSYRTGALWTVRHPKRVEQRHSVEQALRAAEARVPFP